MSKKTAVIIVLAIVAIALFGLLALNNNKKAMKNSPELQSTNQPEQTEGFKQPEIKQVEVAALPEKFPADFPIEAGAKILSNYNVDNGPTIQASRQFASKKTLAENYKFYSDYLKTNGWTILAQSDETILKSIAAIKDNVNLMININQNSLTKQNAVDITFTFPK